MCLLYAYTQETFPHWNYILSFQMHAILNTNKAEREYEELDIFQS